jgi:EEF1A N-terminal glycine/lysine methyltransferase
MYDSEDIFAGSLETLYNHAPVTYASSGGADFVYTHTRSGRTFQIAPPDTTSANHALHASDIWVSSVFLADHIDELELDDIVLDGDDSGRLIRVLELGAGAGLPSIVLSGIRPDVCVVVSDYPDEKLIRALSDNVARNDVNPRCTAISHAWGEDVTPLFLAAGDDGAQGGFDVVLAADTLWNSEGHGKLVQTLANTLRRGEHSRAHLIAGLHTGRWALAAFVRSAQTAGFELVSAEEREVRTGSRRPWCVDRGPEDDAERRRWVVWFTLRWAQLRE